MDMLSRIKNSIANNLSEVFMPKEELQLRKLLCLVKILWDRINTDSKTLSRDLDKAELTIHVNTIDQTLCLIIHRGNNPLWTLYQFIGDVKSVAFKGIAPDLTQDQIISTIVARLETCLTPDYSIDPFCTSMLSYPGYEVNFSNISTITFGYLSRNLLQ